jgi:acyl-coenzyme A synthetase/AMP-(fatty) acid ligase
MTINSLWHAQSEAGLGADAVFHGKSASLPLAQLAEGSTLPVDLETLRGRCVVLATQEQLGTAIALLELDGVAARLVLCTPDLKPEQLRLIAETADADFILCDQGAHSTSVSGIPTLSVTARAERPVLKRRASHVTEWILLTSGTTGNPKLVAHTLESLGGGLPRGPNRDGRTVWSTFYDIRRYGGLQIYLRAVLGAASVLLSSADEPPDAFFARGAAVGVTHISGTPSHWRRALMSGAASVLQPAYVRLSGEVPDQTVLDSLRAAFPHSRIGHAFASTEAGVGFDVNDGLAGFPADYLLSPRNGVEMQIQGGTLRVRSARTASRYLGASAQPLKDEGGWVDTGDRVELLAGRYVFKGRKTGVINVGGLKVHPEEVESVLNADTRVALSLVRARRNPITGAVVVADVVLTEQVRAALDEPAAARVQEELLAVCRLALPPYKVPSQLRFVPALELTPAGKLVRPGA